MSREQLDQTVRDEIARSGPLEAFQKLIAANDALIRGANLDLGGEVARSRTAVYCGLMAHWAEEQRKVFGYDRPFAVVALGGTGREEMTPCSDTDFAFLFDDAIEGNAFLEELQRQWIAGEFRKRCGFSGERLVFNLEDMPELEGKQLNSFLDMQPAYDPDGLADRFRATIRDTYDPFEHFLHVSRFWREHWGESIAKNERLNHFDIKNDGLRYFLAGIWTRAGKDFRHSHEIYAELEDPRDLDAYHFLLRIRSFVHLRRGTHSTPTATGNHKEDILVFDDFENFGEMLGPEASEQARYEFANEVRARLLSARRRVDRFTWGMIGRELQRGRAIRPGSAIVYGSGGLRDTSSVKRETDEEKSRSALSMLLTSQRYGIPIDPSEMETTFHDAGDWLVPVPEFGALFYEPRGSLADSLKFLSQLPETEERLFPGHARFEASFDERVMTEQESLRSALLREKLRALEEFLIEGRQKVAEARNPEDLEGPDFEILVPVEAALLDDNTLAAIRLALKTKRLPVTPEGLTKRENHDLPLHRRFSSGLSGIPLEEFFERCFGNCGFTSETLETAKFLVKNQQAFEESAAEDLMDAHQVERIVARCGNDETRLRALFVFTCADRVKWNNEKSQPKRWFNIRELYTKARQAFRDDFDPTEKLSAGGFSPDELEILQDFGDDFYEGIYRGYAIRFGGYLFRLADSETSGRVLPPQVSRIRIGASEILGVAALDQPGIAASISGAFWKLGVRLSQAHLFSATNHRLALDFFHLAPPDKDVPPPEGKLSAAIAEAIVERRYISDEDEANLPDAAENVTLEETTSGLYRLRAETGSDVGALIYFLTCKAFRRLDANIHGLAAHTGKGHASVSVYLSPPKEKSLGEAEAIVRNW